MSPADRFIATTWWTAHLAHAALRSARRRAIPLPDPGVRAVHLPDGRLRGARRARATSCRTPRCSRPSCSATTSAATAWGSSRRAPRPASATRPPSPNAITRVEPPSERELAAPGDSAAALLRAARAARGAEHVRARDPGARTRGLRRRPRAGLGAPRRRHRRDRASRSTSAEAPLWRCSLAGARRTTRSF